jgi:hypothetical protein
MTDHTKPESEWEYSHALETGDVLVDGDRGERATITVHDDGAVAFDGETFTEREVTAALRDGTLERDDGLSAELAGY